LGIRIVKQIQNSDKGIIREQLEIRVTFKEWKGINLVHKEYNLDGIG